MAEGVHVSYDGETAVITHGGSRNPVRAAVVDDTNTVIDVVLLPSDWHDQNPEQRYSPAGEVVVLDEDENPTIGASRADDGTWAERDLTAITMPIVSDSHPTAQNDDALRRDVDLLLQLVLTSPVSYTHLTLPTKRIV